MRKLLLLIGFLAIALPAGVGLVMLLSNHQTSADPAFAPVSEGGPRPDAREAYPRWDPVANFTGSGAAQKSFAIAQGASHWRASWSCETGPARITVRSQLGADEVLADDDCPASGARSWSDDGTQTLDVNASSPWRVAVEEEVVTALEEPPLPGEDKSALLGSGSFHSIQRTGDGTVSLYRLPTGRLALRFKDFYVSPSRGLQIWLSEGQNIESTLQARQARHTNIGVIRSTMGTYSQMLPAGTDPARIHSVVIWCPFVTIAFAAAPLSAP